MNALTPTGPAPSTAMTVAEPATAPAGTVAGSLLNFVARAMTDPAINVEKLEALLRLQRQIVADDAQLRFNRAMSAAQAEMQPVLRDASNDQTKSRYARLETIDAAIRPIYTRHGFCLEFNSETTDGPNETIVCEVSHEAGHAKTYRLTAPLDLSGPQGKANKTPLHGLGSTISYLRRYLTCMIFNVVLAHEDNDGNRVRDTGELTGRTEIAELQALIADCSADPKAVAANERAFLNKMGLGELRSLADAPATHFPRLRNALLTKKSVLAQRAAAATRTA